MSNEIAKDDTKPAAEASQTTRRAFVKTATQVAVTAPAVSILLGAKPTAAQIAPYGIIEHHILDDFTFGNTHEDVDAIERQTNFSNWNGRNNQDDVFIPPPPG
jgi:hypothetical protein